MSLHESGQMYLESILVLHRKNGSVRSIDVVEYMNYSKPTPRRKPLGLKLAYRGGGLLGYCG